MTPALAAAARDSSTAVSSHGLSRLPRPLTLLGAGCVHCSMVMRPNCCALSLRPMARWRYMRPGVHEEVEFDPNTPLIQLFMPWFFHCWAPDHLATEVVDKSLHDVIPTKAYLAVKGRRLDPLLRRYLESVLTAPFTFFEVLACDPGTGMTLRDVMTQEEHEVTERAASQGMQLGDLLFGQLATVDGLTMLEAFSGIVIPPKDKA